jgi:glycosyltransferase involved in cell wall biosynthesis
MITIDLRWLHTSGIGTYLRNIIPEVVASFPAQCFVLLGNRNEIEDLVFPNNAKIHVVTATSKMYSLTEQMEIPRIIAKDTTLFFAPHYNIPLLYQGKMLVTVYDLFHLAMPDLVGGFHKTLYARSMFNAVRRKATAIITISHFSKNELIRFTGEGRQQVYPIHLGVDESWFNVKPVSNPHGKRYLLYAGNVKPHKNLIALIKAFGVLANDIPHDLVIVGKKEGFITGSPLTTIEAAKQRERVTFTGYVSEEALKQYMAHADAFVFPSLYEGFGLPPIEAMACGCPAVVSNAASLPEVCGDAALYCDPYDYENIAGNIREMLNNERLRETLRKQGLIRAAHFTWKKCISDTCKVIDNLL